MRRQETRYIIVHTAGFGLMQGPFNVAVCDDWHKKNGWSGIGYHFVIQGNSQGCSDGAIETGRALEEVGAHARGLNSVSVGICMAGNGDVEVWSLKQQMAFVHLCGYLMDRYNIPIEGVIGHREINRRVSSKYKTSKTCPGKLINMDLVRGLLL